MNWDDNEEWSGASLEHWSGLTLFSSPIPLYQGYVCETIVKVGDLKDGHSL